MRADRIVRRSGLGVNRSNSLLIAPTERAGSASGRCKSNPPAARPSFRSVRRRARRVARVRLRDSRRPPHADVFGGRSRTTPPGHRPAAREFSLFATKSARAQRSRSPGLSPAPASRAAGPLGFAGRSGLQTPRRCERTIGFNLGRRRLVKHVEEVEQVEGALRSRIAHAGRGGGRAALA